MKFKSLKFLTLCEIANMPNLSLIVGFLPEELLQLLLLWEMNPLICKLMKFYGRLTSEEIIIINAVNSNNIVNLEFALQHCYVFKSTSFTACLSCLLKSMPQNCNVLRFLIEHNIIGTDALNSSEYLYSRIRNNDIDSVYYLLSQNISSPHPLTESPLTLAIIHKNFEIVKILKSFGAHITKRHLGVTHNEISKNPANEELSKIFVFLNEQFKSEIFF